MPVNIGVAGAMPLWSDTSSSRQKQYLRIATKAVVNNIHWCQLEFKPTWQCWHTRGLWFMYYQDTKLVGMADDNVHQSLFPRKAW